MGAHSGMYKKILSLRFGNESTRKSVPTFEGKGEEGWWRGWYHWCLSDVLANLFDLSLRETKRKRVADVADDGKGVETAKLRRENRKEIACSLMGKYVPRSHALIVALCEPPVTIRP